MTDPHARPHESSARSGGARSLLCPYCGDVTTDPKRCVTCGGRLDPLSRQATQNAMGPWFIRDLSNPFRPGCSFETLRELIRRGKIGRDTVIRGPTTRQFWAPASRSPGVANLLGQCHSCQRTVDPDAYMCPACGAVFTPESDRQHLGVAPIHLLPGQATPEIIAAASGPPTPGAARASVDDQWEIAATPPAREPRSTGGAPRWIVAFLIVVILLLLAGLAAVIVGPQMGLEIPFLPGAPDSTAARGSREATTTLATPRDGSALEPSDPIAQDPAPSPPPEESAAAPATRDPTAPVPATAAALQPVIELLLAGDDDGARALVQALRERGELAPEVADRVIAALDRRRDLDEVLRAR